LRSKLLNIGSAFSRPDARVVFNCTGNSSKDLPGVEDSKRYPTRGQIVLAKAAHVQKNIMRHGRNYKTYIIPRPWSNGNVVLGGYMQKGVGTSDTFAYETESILQRTSALQVSSELTEAEPEVLASFSGLRPSREGGARVELVELIVDGQTRVLVHNYGASGTGFQAGYGIALEAVEAIEDVLQGIAQNHTGAKLRRFDINSS
ncbi:hypothetical protein BDP81DRAFT_329529, partial [Colletotrichum phormii]